MKVVGIIQARMGATRLPGKMMLKINGEPIIAQVFARVKSAKLLNQVWLATTTEPVDNVLADWAKQNNISYYRGSLNDVLDRYYQTALQAKAEVIARITGDCPLIDGAVIDKVAGEYLIGGYDYVCNTLPPTYPDGLDTEVFSFNALAKAWAEAKLASEREHVTPYIWKHPELFKIKNVENDVNLNSYRWTLDTPEDFEFIKLVTLEALKTNDFSLQLVLNIVNTHPEWQKINSKFNRNEGYAKSLKQDKIVKP